MQGPNFSHHHSKVKMNRLTMLILFRFTILTLSLRKILINSLNDFCHNSLENAFETKKRLLATRKMKSLKNPLFRARFDVVPKPIASPKNIGLHNCQDQRCLLHCHSYINPCK